MIAPNQILGRCFAQLENIKRQSLVYETVRRAHFQRILVASDESQ